MNAVGIDISKGKSMIAIMRPLREIVNKPFEISHIPSELDNLVNCLKSLEGETKIITEYTGKYYQPIAQFLIEKGFFASIIHAKLIHDFGNNSIRKVKTDKGDAVKIVNYGLTHRRKDYKDFCRDLKKFYGAPSLKACKASFEAFKQRWSNYPGAIAVWERNFTHVEQLFDFGGAIRKIMYTTNAIESIHASFRKVTKKGAFPNENALLKLLYLRVSELERKWATGHIRDWSLVLNQLMMNEPYSKRIEKYSVYL